MRTISFITLILTLMLGFSCKSNPKQKKNNLTETSKKETNPSTVNLNTTFTTIVHSINNGDSYFTESTFNNKLLKDSSTNHSDINNYEVYILVHGFEKNIIDTLRQKDFEKFLTDSSSLRRDNVNDIKLTKMTTDLESGVVKLQYQVDNEDLRHLIEYQLSIKNNILTDKKLIHVETTKQGDKKNTSLKTDKN
jgi:hypothetical protein